MQKPHFAKSRDWAFIFRRIVTFSDSISPDTLRLNQRGSEPIWVETLGTSVAEKASFISRFFYKILEIMEAVTIMEFKGAAEDMARISHPHPTYTEAVREAALAATENRPLHI